MIYGTSIAILTSVFPVGERGKALGIYLTFAYFGLTVGPFLGGVLTQYLAGGASSLSTCPSGLPPACSSSGGSGVTGGNVRASGSILPARSSMRVPLSR